MRRAPQREATVVDVAREAGVSPMTVSRVVNNKKYVSTEARKRVQEAAQRVGYKPNLAGRTLRARRNLRIGVLYGNPSASYLNQLMLGVLQEAIAVGAHVELERCTTRASYSRAARHLLGLNVGGIILPSPAFSSLRTIRELQAAGIRVVAAGTSEPVGGISSVGIDDYKAACTITRYVIGLGHRRLAFVKGDPTHPPAQRRAQGFLDTMRQSGLGVPPSYIADGNFTFRSGLVAGEQLLSQPVRPTAIICSNDDMAAAVVAMALRRSLQVPRDLSVTGFDDTEIASITWPTLTTIHQPTTSLGRTAVRLLMRELHSLRPGESVPQRHERLKHRIVRRESTARLP